MPTSQTSAITPAQFTTFGDLLKYLRRRAGLSQQELAIGVGYSVSHLSRLENNQRLPDAAALAARFVHAIDLEREWEWVARLLELVAESRKELRPQVQAGAAQTVHHSLLPRLTLFVGCRRQQFPGVRHAATRRMTRERLMAQTRAELGDKAFEAAWIAGERTPFDNLIKELLSK